MTEEAPTMTPNSEKKASHGEKISGNRKSKDSGKSLSTITEEPTSVPTVSSKTNHDNISFSSTTSTELQTETMEKPKIKTPLPPPILPEPIPTRAKRHTSTVLKSSSREVIIPHDRPRTLSMQERLLSHIQFAGKPLFPTVLGQQQPPKTASILITGFGLRNLSSLQEALQIEEHNKLKQLYRAQERQDQSASSLFSGSTESDVSVQFSRQKTESSSETQTERGSTTCECPQKKKLMYLMGLHAASAAEEGGDSTVEVPEVPREEDAGEGEPSLSEAMKQAQKYLRVHKIFELFQFIIPHLLSALPENPIEFIIDLLDKCLIFRAGFIEPPLLYNRNHLERLFYLMDKMRTGCIELEQYKTGMRTVGICKFNEKPYLTHDGMVTKEVFVEEAYDCLAHLLTDMIKRRWIRAPHPITPPPPPTPQISTIASSTDECDTHRFRKTRLFLDCV